MIVEIRDDNTKTISYISEYYVLGQGKQGGGTKGKRQDTGHMRYFKLGSMKPMH